jgi:hypothetical protein
MLVGEILLEVAAESARARIGKKSDTGVLRVTAPNIMMATESSGVGTTRMLLAMIQEGISGMMIVSTNTRDMIVEGTTVDIKIPAGETAPVTGILAHTTAMTNEKPTSALGTMMIVGEMTVHGTGIVSVIVGEMMTESGKAAEINFMTARLDRGATVRVGAQYRASRTRVQIGAMALRARIGLARRIGQTSGIQPVRIGLVRDRHWLLEGLLPRCRPKRKKEKRKRARSVKARYRKRRRRSHLREALLSRNRSRT